MRISTDSGFRYHLLCSNEPPILLDSRHSTVDKNAINGIQSQLHNPWNPSKNSYSMFREIIGYLRVLIVVSLYPTGAGCVLVQSSAVNGDFSMGDIDAEIGTEIVSHGGVRFTK